MSSFRVGEALVSGKGGTVSARRASLSQCVREAIEAYFSDLNGHPPTNLYEMVMREVEKPLLASVMKQVQGNQTRAAQMLGINRSTLRKKLIQYGLNG